MKIKGIVHTKMKILSSFTHLHLVPNLNDWLISVKHKISYFKEHWGPEFFTFIIWTKTFNFHFWVNYRFKHFSVEIRCFTQSDIQFKGIVHQKRQFCDPFTPLYVVPNLYGFLLSKIKEDIWIYSNRFLSFIIWTKTIKIFLKISSFLFSFFGWTSSLNTK